MKKTMFLGIMLLLGGAQIFGADDPFQIVKKVVTELQQEFTGYAQHSGHEPDHETLKKIPGVFSQTLTILNASSKNNEEKIEQAIKINQKARDDFVAELQNPIWQTDVSQGFDRVIDWLNRTANSLGLKRKMTPEAQRLIS